MNDEPVVEGEDAPEKPKRGRPKNVEVTCVARNVWTSKGKIRQGDTISLSSKEAEDLKTGGYVA